MKFLPYSFFFPLHFNIDDDITFISKGTFEALALEKGKDKFFVLSANVVNHPLLSHLHARSTAWHPFVPNSNLDVSSSEEVTNWRISQLPTTEYPNRGHYVYGRKHTWVPLVGANGLEGTVATHPTYDAFSECTWR